MFKAKLSLNGCARKGEMEMERDERVFRVHNGAYLLVYLQMLYEKNILQDRKSRERIE